MERTFTCLLTLFCHLSYVVSVTNNEECFTFDMKVDVRSATNVVDEKFLSIGIDTGVLCENGAWEEFNTSSPLLLTLSKALSPSYLRFGGTSGDYVIFNKTHDKPTERGVRGSHCGNNTVLTKQDWIKLNKYAIRVGFHLIFGLNALLRDGRHWNPSNARKLLKVNEKLGFQPGWELGNELNSHHQLEGAQLGRDFVVLKHILESFNHSKSSLLVGPDVTGRKFSNFLVPFLYEAKAVIDAITFHHYYFSGRTATMEDFLNVENFDALKAIIKTVFKAAKKTGAKQKVWLGETSTAYGGGAPGLSDRYVAGFLWLDKLGLSAACGVDVVMKQSLYSGRYALLTRSFTPVPTYWLSLLYKWLVGRKVLHAKIVPKDRKLRVYAHCMQKGRLYKTSDGITIYVINLHNSTVKIAVPTECSASSIHRYLLTPPKKMGLLSMSVALNGQELKMNNTQIPDIVPKVLPPNSPLILPPFTYGFYVFPEAVAPVCLK